MSRHLPFCPLSEVLCAVALTTFLATAPAVAGDGIGQPDAVRLAAQMESFHARVPGSIFALQPYRNDQTVIGEDGTKLTLTSLNPAINSWFVLDVTSPAGRTLTYHLENADRDNWQLSLTDETDPGLRIVGDGEDLVCRPWQGELAKAREGGLPFAPICDWRLYLRNRVSGSRTSREAVAAFLRKHVLFGDSIVNLIKGTFYKDAFMVSSKGLETDNAGETVALLGQARLDRHPVMRAYMGFDLVGADAGMEAGAWYAVKNAPGIFASVVQPGLIAKDILRSPGANRLDGVESRADVYLVAFDLDQFEMGYEVGTDNPGVEWSSRPRQRHNQGGGPDGFGTTAPLITVGMVSPSVTDRVAATFTGGFKRDHGAWRFGKNASINFGLHYGFLENGVMLSRLWPTLATLYATTDGTIGMKTWTKGDEALLPNLVFARQNGVPLIENGVPGDAVTSRGNGNWSGSADAELRTLRGGACLRTVGDRRILIYAWFSTATPSAMARTFQAYGCNYAMLLDMNNQELTYMALYVHHGEAIETQHLVAAMAEADQRRSDGTSIPRFVGVPDNRDFFYLLRKE